MKRSEGAGEVPGREAGAFREPLDGQIRVRVLADPLLDLAQGLAAGGLSSELGAELRLITRAPEEDDEMAGDGERGVPAVVFLDQGEREIDACGDSGRGGDLPVADEDRIRIDVHVRIRTSQVGAERPVRRRATAVQQPGLGQQQRAAAHRHDAFRVPGMLPQPVDQGGDGVAGAVATRDEQGVRRPERGQRAVRDEGEPTRGTDRGTVERGDADLVGIPTEAPGSREHLHRAGHVETLHTVEDDDQHGSLRHDADPVRQPRWLQGRKPHSSCHA